MLTESSPVVVARDVNRSLCTISNDLMCGIDTHSPPRRTPRTIPAIRDAQAADDERRRGVVSRLPHWR